MCWLMLNNFMQANDVVPTCSWTLKPKPRFPNILAHKVGSSQKLPIYPPHQPPQHEALLRYFNKLNCTVILHRGSALGAVRHGGTIPGDADADVILPVWLNPLALQNPLCAPDVIKWHAYQHVLQQRGFGGLTREMEPTTFCNQTRRHWVKEIRKYLLQLKATHKSPVKYLSPARPWGGLRVNNMDIIVSIFDRMVLSSQVCYCRWYTLQVFCLS